MSGWLLLSDRTRAIEKIEGELFSILTLEGLPSPTIEVIPMGEGIYFISWGWSRLPLNDCHIYKSGHGGNYTIINGYLTGMGRYENSDHEIVEKGVEIWERGEYSFEEIISELNGSFSITEKRQDKIRLGTDRFASRSVWFSIKPKAWIFGNFPSTIAALGQGVLLDPIGLWSLLANSRHLGTHGLYQGISNLQAGQYLVFDLKSNWKVQTWYQRRYDSIGGKSIYYWGENIAHTLRQSAKRLEAVTTSPFLFLSGGLDSRIAAGAYGSDLKSLTLTSHVNMNSRLSENVARHLGIQHQTLIRPPNWIRDTYEAAALLAGGNYNIHHAHFIKPVMDVVSKEPAASFLLGDLLENFNKHYFKSGADILDTIDARSLPTLYHRLFGFSHQNPQNMRRLFHADIAKRMEQSWSDELSRLYQDTEQWSERFEDRLDAQFRWSNCSMCPTYLMLECIIPFAKMRNLMFDNDLLQLLHSIPASLRGTGRLHKWILWNLDKRLVFIPNSNYWLPPILPNRFQEITRRIRPVLGKARRQLISLVAKGPANRTEGSWQINIEWFRKDLRYRNFIDHCLNDPLAFPSEIFNRKELHQNWMDFLNGNDSKLYEIEMLLSVGLLNRKIMPCGISNV